MPNMFSCPDAVLGIQHKAAEEPLKTYCTFLHKMYYYGYCYYYFKYITFSVRPTQTHHYPDRVCCTIVSAIGNTQTTFSCLTGSDKNKPSVHWVKVLTLTGS